jgi:hypothetical protein
MFNLKDAPPPRMSRCQAWPDFQYWIILELSAQTKGNALHFSPWTCAIQVFAATGLSSAIYRRIATKSLTAVSDH